MTLAFAGLVPANPLGGALLALGTAKVLEEAVAAPLTSRVVAWLKSEEHLDTFDDETDFNRWRL